MALLITPANRHELSSYLDQYFQLRHRVFNLWLGWGLDSQNGREIDQFDHDETVYILSLDEEGRVSGGVRLAPTTRDYMISSVFPEIWDDNALPCDPGIWEASRYAVDWEGLGRDRDKVRKAGGDISCGISEFCVLNDIYEIIGIFETRFAERTRKGFGDPIWRSQERLLGDVPSVAARFAVSYPHLRSLREMYRLPTPTIQQFAEILHA